MKSLSTTGDQKIFFKKPFQTSYDSSFNLFRSEHTSLRQMKHENAKILNISSSQYNKYNVDIEEREMDLLPVDGEGLIVRRVMAAP